MAFWWVNHKQTRDHEVQGGYLWSPKRNVNGAFNQSYENMTLVRPGDTVFSYAGGRISAIGHVTQAASACPKPSEFGSVGNYWSEEGWLVDLYFTPTPKPVTPKAHIDAIAPLLPRKHSPIQPNGNGNQVCYLASISDALGLLVLNLAGIEAAPAFGTRYFVNDPGNDASVLEDLQAIGLDTAIPETQRLQLAKARIGQGLFRKRVMLIGPRCRVTGVEDPRLLIASHIKPWANASNEERINGFNGLMLSPHIDALFDEHLISFEDSGRMLVHSSLPIDVLDRWSIRATGSYDSFDPKQAAFLEHHRRVFAQKQA